MKGSIQLYRRLLGSLKPYRKVVLLSVLAMVVAASLEPVLPAAQALVDESLIGKSKTAQWRVPLFLMLAFQARGIAEYAANVEPVDRQQGHHRPAPAGIPPPDALADVCPSGRERWPHAVAHPLDIPQVSSALSNAWIIVIRDSR